MRTIEVKMHYTFLGFFKFFYYFGWKYLFVPHFIIMYILSFFIDSLAFFIRNGIAHLIAYFILATFCILFFLLFLSSIFYIKLHGHKNNTYIFDEEKITHIYDEVKKYYYYKQFKKVYPLKRYMYFKKIARFYITTDKLSENEKKYIITCINK